MKHLLFVFVLSVILFSCKKEIALDREIISPKFNFKVQLKDSMATSEFQQLDVEHTFITKYEKNDLTIARIPFINKGLANDFVLLKLEKNGAFSIGKSTLETVRAYIQNQEEHHKKISFEDEFRLFLKKYGVTFNEQYVWD